MVRLFMEESSAPVLRGCPNNRSRSQDQEPIDVDVISSGSSSQSKESSETRGLSLQGGDVHEKTTKQENRPHFVSRRHLKAIQLNYAGVCLLQSGEDEERAITLFKQSLACIKCDLASENSSKTTTPSSTTETSLEPPRGSTTCWSTRQSLSDAESARRDPGPLLASFLEPTNDHHHVHPPIIVPVQVQEPSSLDEDLFVYTKAFVFQPCFNHREPGHHFQNISCPCSVVDSELLSATIIYNIGLGLHIKSIRTKSWYLKQRSLSLYEMSIGLLRRILNGNKNDDDSNKNDDDNHFVNVTVDSAHQSLTSAICTSLLIACSNNIGHLSYYLQDDYERSRRTTCNLKFLLNLFWTRLTPEGREAGRLESTRSRSSSYFMSPLEHADIQGFTWNVRFMLPPTFAPAA